MRHRILLFAGMRAAAETEYVDVEVDGAATVSEVLTQLETILPESADLIRISRLAVDGRYVSNEETIRRNTGEIALIPPVSGG